MVPPNNPAVRPITGFAGKPLFVTADTVDEHLSWGWRVIRPYEVFQDYVVTTKRPAVCEDRV